VSPSTKTASGAWKLPFPDARETVVAPLRSRVVKIGPEPMNAEATAVASSP
jgi:hypothetical protein